jgi:hypothetical protein
MKPLHELSDDELAHWAHRALALPDAPAHWIQRAIALQPAAAGPQASLLETLAAGLRLVVATLSFDSWAAPALAPSMRSGSGATRHLLFSAAGRDLDLRISPDADGYTVSGQILGPDESGSVTLDHVPQDGAAPATRRVEVDTLGEFRLAGLSAGTCTLNFLLGDERVTLPPIELGDPPP